MRQVPFSKTTQSFLHLNNFNDVFLFSFVEFVVFVDSYVVLSQMSSSWTPVDHLLTETGRLQ